MNVKLEKWYLDITSKNAVGFYYVMIVSFGRFKIGFSGINHFDSVQSVQSFKFSRIKRKTIHRMQLSKANLLSTLNRADLTINHRKTGIDGTWNFLAKPQRRLRKPLFENSNGWVDWKVWTPFADVELVFRSGEEISRLKGTGYIDFVRMSFPLWKMPFQTLYWGRIHSPHSWGVFLSLQTRGEEISLYLDPKTTVQDVSVSLMRNQLGIAQNMIWNVGSLDAADRIEGEVIRILENQEIMNRGKYFRILPQNIRQKLSSLGRDEKYEVISKFQDQAFRGIMEEVKYYE